MKSYIAVEILPESQAWKFLHMNKGTLQDMTRVNQATQEATLRTRQIKIPRQGDPAMTTTESARRTTAMILIEEEEAALTKEAEEAIVMTVDGILMTIDRAMKRVIQAIAMI